MCVRRKRRGKRNKKKLTCCQRCRRRIGIWCCRRIKRCLKRAVFGRTEPHLDEYEIAGYNLSTIRDTFQKKEKPKKKSSVITLFRNNKSNKSTQSIPMKDLIVNEIDRYSFSKSIGQKMQGYLDDFKERNLYLFPSKETRLNLNASEKETIRKVADEYEKRNKKSFIGFLKSIELLKRKFSLPLSKVVVLKNMIADYKNKKISFSGVIDISKYKKSNFNVNNLEKQDLDKLLSYYKAQKKSKAIFSDRKISLKDLEIMNVIDSEGIKKKFSLTNSRQLLLNNMIEDHKNGKFTLSTVPDDLKANMKKIDKQNLNKILDYYKTIKNKKMFSFIKQSRIKQLKSDLRAKVDFI